MKALIERIFEPQPAILMYAYDGGWWVMHYVVTHVFSRTHAAAQDWFIAAEPWKIDAQVETNYLYKFFKWMVWLGYYFAGFGQYVSAMMVLSLFVLVLFLILTTWIILTSFAMLIWSIYNGIYGLIYQIFYRCPDCHEQMTLPTFLCPTCGEEHTRLWPSPYGVFSHRCASCNTKLPTFARLGRKNLVRKCVSCKTPINKDVGQLVNVHIPVIGGPSAGKSNYIFTATREFIEIYAKPQGYEVSFPDSHHQETYEQHVKNLQDGQVLLKTTDIVPQAYNIAIKQPHKNMGRIVYLYDAAGEAYSHEDDTFLQIYYQYIHGLVFIIDPFSIDLYKRRHETEIESLNNVIRPSELRVMDAYERMVSILEASQGLKRGEKFDQPIAVIISKTDALNLEFEIGLPAARRLMKDDESIYSEEEAMHQLVQQFLKDNGLENFMRDLDYQFTKVRYFSCSALGRLPDSNAHGSFVPMRVLPPLLWLLSHTKVINHRRDLVTRTDLEHREQSSRMGNIFRSAKHYYWDSLAPK